MNTDRPANRLAAEPSLYLRQHAHNPVDWYPWSHEALARARNENKPILLSIGYSACHWCHVMERESFEDAHIAARMNELFVSIKVDREERPDLDSLYMKAVQMMTGRGGWPMTVFLTPDLEPFYAGTYFPPVDRGGMPGFEKVLQGVANAWRERGDQVRESGAEIARRLASLSRISGSASAPSVADLDTAAESLAGIMDPEHGGFGNAPQFAPKFPGTLCLSFLIGAGRGTGASAHGQLVRTALDRMADGGIHDHLAGGFHRYSVDRYWLAPHFEKMLYDQALLADVYAEGWLAFGEERYGRVMEGILEYVARDLRSPDGGFHATQDADSEGVEGKYFVWTPDEVAAVVGEADGDLVCRFFDVTGEGNFEGKNILRCTLGPDAIDKIGAMYGRTPEDCAAAIDRARAALLERRSQRVPPATDTKILTDWNGLMIGAMARGGRLRGRSDLVAVAARATDFVRDHLIAADQLLHFYAEGEARVGAFLDDHAFFGRGCLEVYLATGRGEDLATARAMADILLERFEDTDHGGFFFADGSDRSVIVRERDLHDSAVPSGNAVAAELLLRLHQITGEDRYRDAGERTIEAFLEQALRNPHGGAHLLCVADRQRRGFATAVIARADGAGGDALTEAALRAHAPEVSVIRVLAGADEQGLPPAARGKSIGVGAAAAYVCRGATCSKPVTGTAELGALLQA